MKHCPRAVSIARPSTLQHTELPSELAAAPYGGGQFNRGSMIVREVVSLMEGEWLCYGGGQFNGRSMVMLQKWSL